LKLETVTRYYFQKGRVIASLKNDPDIKEGTAILNDQQLYQSVLAGKYKQPPDEINEINNEEQILDDETDVN